jgi:hypothetical protein
VARSHRARRTKITSPGGLAFAVTGMVLMSAVLLVPGIFFLVQRETGTRATATIDSCETTGAGRYADTECSGSWVVGGSILDKGSIVLGTIQGADESDVGKAMDVTVVGDQAYSRDLKLPVLLIGLGLVPIGLAILVVLGYFRKRRAAAAAAGAQVPDSGPSGKWRAK